MKDFITYCKEYIAENLPEHEGNKEYLCDLGYSVTDGPNMDGTLTYNRAEAQEYLKEWWNEAADYFDYEKDNFGTTQNPFENPETYMVCMVIQGVNSLISQACSVLNLDWDDKVELTADLIEEIIDAVNNNDTCRLF